MSMIVKENSNLEVADSSPIASFELKQRRRMLLALALLLVALIVVLIKDRQFWFPSSANVEPEASEQNSVSAAKTAAPTISQSRPPQALPGKSARTQSRRAAASAVPKSPDAEASVGPVVTTSRAVLPPLEVEVVAGNQRRSLAPTNNAVKVDMQSGEPVDSRATSSGTSPGSDAALANTSAKVSLSPGTAERVARSVKPDYPLLAKQMKVQGAVVLQALIDKTGGIQELHVVSGPAILASAAQEAVKQWHFKPYYQGGQAVDTEARITVNFTISTY
jgi:TonB family protein